MQQEKVMSVEAIDQHLNSVKIPSVKRKDNAMGIDICSYYQQAKPIIIFASALLFFKPKWQQVISELIAELDKVCPLQ